MVGSFFSTVYKAMPSRDRTVTETTRVFARVVSVTLSRVVSVTSKTVTSLHALKMADSVPLDTAVDSVPIRHQQTEFPL